MSSQSSLSNVITTMQSAETYLYEFISPILIFFGTISCALNLFVFTQKTLRKNPCSIYFIAYNCAHFIYIYFSLLVLTLDIGYNINLSASNLNVCRLCLYIAILFNCLSPFYLILASIDRILITSSNALTRRRSTCRLAYVSLTIVTLFWALFHTHAIVMATIIQITPNYSICLYNQDTYLIFIGYYSIIKEMITVSLLSICGLWSIKNIQYVNRVRIAPSLSLRRMMTHNNLRSTSRKDRQLVLMLLMDISIYTVFSLILAIFHVYQQITQYNIKSNDRKEIEAIINKLCLFCAAIPFCVSFYTNLIVSKTFRNELTKAFSSH